MMIFLFGNEDIGWIFCRLFHRHGLVKLWP